MADALEVVKDYIKVNEGKMSVAAFAEKWDVSYQEFLELAYVLKRDSEKK